MWLGVIFSKTIEFPDILLICLLYAGNCVNWSQIYFC